LEQYLAPVSPQSPCGENDYDDRDLGGILSSMLESVVGGSDRGMVASDSPGQGSGDWTGLLAEVGGFFGRTKNLGLARFALLADLNINGLAGLADGLVLFNQLLSRYWLEVYPRIEDGDFEERLESIARIDDPLVISGLGKVVVAKGKRSGSYTLEQATSSMEKGEPSPSLIEGSVNETLGDDPEFYDRLAAECREIRQQFGFIRDILQEHLGSPSVSFTGIEGRLTQLEAFLAHSAVVPASAIAAGEEVPGGTAPAAAVQAQPGEIRTRADVTRALDQLIRFYRKTEPTSPVPHLLYRAKRVVGMDFMEIVQEFRLSGSPAISDVFGALDDDSSSS
jgi:type VI secretion system protein ImpA